MVLKVTLIDQRFLVGVTDESTNKINFIEPELAFN